MKDLVPRSDPYNRRVIVDFMIDRFREAGAETAVIGISGGLDSSLALGLTVEALGRERVKGYFLPYGDLGNIDRVHALSVSDAFGTELAEIDITNIVDSVPFPMDGMVKGNAQARARMLVLYARANLQNGLVIGTSNKTEFLLGYFTKFGDGSADLYPLGDLYKTQVRMLAEEVGVPRTIIERPPSAGLIEGQTDEGELRIPYPILDQVLYGHIRDLDPETIADNIDYTTTTVEEMDRAGFEPPISTDGVKGILGTVWRMRHKRCPFAVPKLEMGTVGLDLRDGW
ncbi:MAG: NAD(+) synthase [Candidatus Thermoplasmatota archaeon]|nr:NAD(+) synthase [Candidatus Thermoplasmatota archaeon]